MSSAATTGPFFFSMFVHVNACILYFNAYWLYILGGWVEEHLGARFYGLLFLISGFCSSTLDCHFRGALALACPEWCTPSSAFSGAHSPSVTAHPKSPVAAGYSNVFSAGWCCASSMTVAGVCPSQRCARRRMMVGLLAALPVFVAGGAGLVFPPPSLPVGITFFTALGRTCGSGAEPPVPECRVNGTSP